MINDDLDAKCAIKIMGYIDYKPMYGSDDYGWRKNWHPSTNIAQAWQVLEKVQVTHGWHLSLNCDDSVSVLMQPKDESQPEKETDGDTAALAITKACLKTVED